MDSEPRNIDLWVQETLNSWAEQGTLSRGRSDQLHLKIVQLARQERKNRLIRKACGLVAGTIICIWLLFANCPVAAASYAGSPVHTRLYPQPEVFCLYAIVFCSLLIQYFYAQIINGNIEVTYD